MGGTGALGVFNATSGEIVQDPWIAGLDNPEGLDQAGDFLYVVLSMNTPYGSIFKYDREKGLNILGQRVPLILGLDYPGTVVVIGDDLWVSHHDGISKYNALTGHLIKADFIEGTCSKFCIARETTPFVSSPTIENSPSFDLASYLPTLATFVFAAVLLLLLLGTTLYFSSRPQPLFPNGIPKTDFHSLQGPPKGGCLFASESQLLLDNGLHLGDIIVALDGYRVMNKQEYLYVRNLCADPRMEFIIWRQDRYLEILASVPGRMFDAVIETYVI